MKRQIIPGCVILVLALIIAIGSFSFLGPCVHEDGTVGACHWASRALLGLGCLLAVLAVAGLVSVFVYRAEIKKTVVNWLVPQGAAGTAAPHTERRNLGGEDAETQAGWTRTRASDPVDPVEETRQRTDETSEAYFERMLPLAEKGEVLAQLKVAEAFFYGRGTPTNRVDAVSWYHKAADAGDASAQASLGFCLLNGLGCEKDPHAAVEWYSKGAEQDDLNAIHGLAYCHLHGFGVEKDEKKGFDLAMKAAVRGHAPSQTLVGECFHAGLGVEQDKERGDAWLYRATRQNNKRAETLLQAY